MPPLVLRHNRPDLLGFLLQIAHHGTPLGRRPLHLSLASRLGLGTLGIHLLLEQSLTLLLGLGSVDVFHQRSLVLKGVALAEMVELVVEVLVDLAAGTVLDEQPAEDPETAHPQDLRRHAGIGGTLPLAKAAVATDSPGEVQLAGPGSRVHGDGLADDEAIRDELPDGLAGVGVADLVDLGGIQPDLALPASYDGRGKALLRSEVGHL